MIKIGNRHNLIHPLLLTLFIALRRIESIVMAKIYNFEGPFLLSVLIFLSKFIFGLYAYYYSNKEIKIQNRPNTKYFGLILVKLNNEIKLHDKWYKITILIILASYFDFAGTVVRQFYIKISQNNTIEKSVRSFQVFSSAIFCYLTLKTNIYRHHLFSLIIIFFCLILIFIAEMLCVEIDTIIKLIIFGLTCFSCVSRALLDTVEKYLFEYDFMNPFKVMMFEGLINTILTSSLFFILKKPLDDINELTEKISKHDFLLIIFLLLYLILSGFKNIYRVTTIKLNSPMARALAESLLDPLIVIHFLFNHKKSVFKTEGKFWIYCGVIIFCSIIMPFFSCVYNEFIILFCCKLDYETHVEITKRSSKTYDSDIIVNIDDSNENDIELIAENDIDYNISQY